MAHIFIFPQKYMLIVTLIINTYVQYAFAMDMSETFVTGIIKRYYKKLLVCVKKKDIVRANSIMANLADCKIDDKKFFMRLLRLAKDTNDEEVKRLIYHVFVKLKKDWN